MRKITPLDFPSLLLILLQLSDCGTFHPVWKAGITVTQFGQAEDSLYH